MDDREELTNEEQETAAYIKKCKVMFGTGLGAGILAFLVLILGVVLQDRGAHGTDVVCIIAALACMIIGLVLLIKAYPGLMISEVDRAEAEYDRQELSQLPVLERSRVEQQLCSCGFKRESGGYFTKKKFSFIRDSIHYYVRITSCQKLESVVEREEKTFAKLTENDRNACLILLAYPTRFNETIKVEVKSIDKINLVYESLDPYAACSTLVMAVDSQTGTGYYLDNGKKHRTSLYAHSCKMLKKITQTAV